MYLVDRSVLLFVNLIQYFIDLSSPFHIFEIQKYFFLSVFHRKLIAVQMGQQAAKRPSPTDLERHLVMRVACGAESLLVTVDTYILHTYVMMVMVVWILVDEL